MTDEPSLAGRLCRLAEAGLRISFWLWVILAVGCVFLTTLGTDEAWVLNGIRSLLRPPVPDLSSEPIATNGGLFALAHLGLEWAFGSRVWVHRGFSLASLLALVAVVSWRGGRPRRLARPDLLAIAPLLGIAGTAEVGTAALGTSTAVLLLVLASLIWSGSTSPGIGRSVLCGLLFGLSASSRFDLVLFAPALVLVSTFRLDDGSRLRLKAPWQGVAVAAIGLGVFAANQWILTRAAHEIVASRLNVEEMMAVTGVSGHLLDYPRLLNRLLVGIGFVSPGVLVLASASAFWRPGEGTSPESAGTRRFAALVLTMAWGIWLAWALRAPVPHLRYLWPSLALFAAAAGIGLSAIHQRYARANDSVRAVLCQLIALGLMLGGIGGTFRSVVLGESDYLSWEWSREMGADYFRRFQHVRDQLSAVAYLRSEIPQEATVLSYVPFPLRYLGERPIASAGGPLSSRQPHAGKTFLVLTPAVGTYLYLRPEAYAWIEANGRLKAQFGNYSFYELPGGVPEDASVLRLTRTGYEKHPHSGYWFGRDAERERRTR